MEKKASLQWSQLIGLTIMHFVADMYPGMLHAVLPAVQTGFKLDIFHGGIVLSVFLVGANGIQLFTGHVRPDKTTPLFMHIGLVLTAAMAFIHLLPGSAAAYPLLLVLVAVSAIGTGITHPEALRSVHTLDLIPSSTATAVFMSGGVAGFAAGGWISAVLFEKFGLKSLYGFAVCSLLTILILIFLRVRLAVENKSPELNIPQQTVEKQQLGFWQIMAMATMAAVSTTVIVWILPQRLSRLEFELSFGGLSVLIFSLAGGAGALLWAAVAHRKSPLAAANMGLVLGLPFMVCYIIFVHSKAAVVLLFLASFCSYGVYPLMVAMAKGSRGLNLGGRMGFIVGGTWLIASLFPMLLGPVAQRYGPHLILMLSPVGYLLSVIFGLVLIRRKAALQLKEPVEQAFLP